MEPVILLCGIPGEPPLRLVAEACAAAGVPTLLLDQRAFARYAVDVRVAAGGINGHLEVDGDRVPLSHVRGVYTRVVDWRVLPGVEGRDASDPTVRSCRELHDRLLTWYENASIRVMNRAASMASNGSKPYQAQFIRRAGFAIPDTLVTNRPDEARAFLREHGRVVFKAISGERTIVTELRGRYVDDLDRLPRCPVQFQRYVDGVDVRVHVVGGDTFATRVDSRAVDYRYDRRAGGPRLKEVALPDDVRRRCIDLACALDLPLAGIDLRFATGGEVYCFEANPSPAFSYYQEATGQPIAAAIVRWLSRDPPQDVGRRHRAPWPGTTASP